MEVINNKVMMSFLNLSLNVICAQYRKYDIDEDDGEKTQQGLAETPLAPPSRPLKFLQQLAQTVELATSYWMPLPKSMKIFAHNAITIYGWFKSFVNS